MIDDGPAATGTTTVDGPGTVADADVVRAALCRNTALLRLLAVAATLDLPQWYVAAGCLTQTVWNARTGRPADHGVRDYDLIYFDATDTSWAAEDEKITAAAKAIGDLPAPVEVRNQARVHLWYEEHFGKPCPPYRSARAAIRTFPSTATSIGVHWTPTAGWRFYAPFGFADLLDLVVRPNTVLSPRETYERKVDRWLRYWPELRVVPWP